MKSITPSTPELRPVTLCWLTACAVVAYAPAQSLPFIADDYSHIAVAREFGPLSGWSAMAADPLYRFRALSSLTAHWIESLFGMSPVAFHIFSLVLHIVSTWLVAALGLWKPIGWKVSIPAAAFFAVAEGHQEAVIWFAAVPEIQVFIAVLAAFLCWVRWLDTSNAWWYAAALGAFTLALLAKESGVVVVGLQVVALVLHEKRRQLRQWGAVIPFAVLGAAYFALIYSTRASHQHFNDGTFSLSAPVVLTLVNSLGRMLWIWGIVAIAVLWRLQGRAALPVLAIAAAWAVISLGPYSFLTYMPRVPSRHTYIASVGLAILAGAAYSALRGLDRSRWIAGAMAAVVILHNVGYLWTKKQSQFAERARATEELVDLAGRTEGKIVVECFPYALSVAEDAIRLHARQSPSRLQFRVDSSCGETHRYSVVPPPASDSLANVRVTPAATAD